jgi:hypothetical protein
MALNVEDDFIRETLSETGNEFVISLILTQRRKGATAQRLKKIKKNCAFAF